MNQSKKMNNFQKIKSEIKSISPHIQAIDEIDGLLWKANEILNSFSTLDWKYLNDDLINWNNDELQILAETIINGNEGEDIVDDNYTFGYVFTLANNSLASCLLNNDLLDFFNENKVESIELLKMMKTKILELYKSEYITEQEFTFWSEYITNVERKAS